MSSTVFSICFPFLKHFTVTDLLQLDDTSKCEDYYICIVLLIPCLCKDLEGWLSYMTVTNSVTTLPSLPYSAIMRDVHVVCLC